MRFAVDTGGTFTDLIVDDESGRHRMFKASTTPEDPVRGVLDALECAATGYSMSRRELLKRGTQLIHGTTHAINAIITKRTARTAFLTTQGHPDVLVLREGGRIEPFNFTVAFPEPYIPRSLTFEISGRIRPDGSEMEPLQERQVIDVLRRLRDIGVESVAVCLLWSIINPEHENRLAQLLERHLPGIPYTLSHRLNPAIREFRRASSTAIDASLKPLMEKYLRLMEQRLREEGFAGRLLIVTSQAGVIDAGDAAEAPIRIVNSGPSMAPVAGRWFGATDEHASTIIVADTGGTTYDVSLVRRGEIPVSRDTWIGAPYRGLMVGFPWVDVRSVGAGGGSIAHVDTGGLLHVGPQSAGASPGPVCYQRGGTEPTVTDAALVLGYLDPQFFLGGAMTLDRDAAADAIGVQVAQPLGLDTTNAAAAILSVATENMAQAIVEITVNQGIDPRSAVLIGGGGAAGLNSVQIARRLGCRSLLLPAVGAALSAAGALMSDLRADFHSAFVTSSRDFDHAGVNEVLNELHERCEKFAEHAGVSADAVSISFTTEARYSTQVWEIEAPLNCTAVHTHAELNMLCEAFHRTHKELFTFSDPSSDIVFIGWSAHVACKLGKDTGLQLEEPADCASKLKQRRAYFGGVGWSKVNVYRLETLKAGEHIDGPAIVESAFTTIVVDPGAKAVRRASGSLSIDVGANS